MLNVMRKTAARREDAEGNGANQVLWCQGRPNLYFSGSMRLSLHVYLKSAGCGWNVKCLLPLTSMVVLNAKFDTYPMRKTIPVQENAGLVADDLSID